MVVPSEYRTQRLLMRPWRADDADRLLPVLEANVDHLQWIPVRIAAPAAVPVLRERLAAHAADFEADRAWRYGLFGLHQARLLGEVSLFPRSDAGRTSFINSDRVEIGYWLRADATGQGFASEATRAALDIAAGIARFRHAEIRCDPRNGPSAAIPARLGFALEATEQGPAPTPSEEPGAMQVWRRPLARPTR